LGAEEGHLKQVKQVMEKASDPKRMRCMEVWGGNVRVEKCFQMPGLEVWVSSQPERHSAAGGDVYYLSSCASGRITRLLLADVSGHGEIVAKIAEGLRDLMRQNVNVISQRRFVAAMNRQFAATSNGEDFATAIVSSFFAPTRSLSLCNAGHPHPLIFRDARQEWTTLVLSDVPMKSAGNATDLPLGIDDHTGYQKLTVRLDKGDGLLCYSDAFTDARGRDGKALGVDGMLQTVASIPCKDAQAFISSAFETIRAMHPSNLSQDDATLMLLRANGTRSSLRDNLLAPFRFFGKVSDVSRISAP
jgi:phosphoserine phosphatase RsbU/P